LVTATIMPAGLEAAENSNVEYAELKLAERSWSWWSGAGAELGLARSRGWRSGAGSREKAAEPVSVVSRPSSAVGRPAYNRL
jgi:hypothetical protein